MGTDKTYRWNRRRTKKSKREELLFDVFDFIILILIFAMSFISLRLLFIFEVVHTPCVELFVTLGQVDGNIPIFTSTYYISILMGLFWGCVTLDKILQGNNSWMRIAWHSIMFSCIFFLAVANRSLVSHKDITPPDGTVVVEVTNSEPHAVGYKDGFWCASGVPTCVWLDRNEVSINDNFNPKITHSQMRFGMKRAHIDVLLEQQSYRPLTLIERERFLTKKACQKDITLYGQPSDICEQQYSYPLPKGTTPQKTF